jgi:DNA-binding MarR family transcriptional regulator
MSTSETNLNKFKPSTDDFDYLQSPFYWVMKLGNKYTQEMEKTLKKVNLNITGWRVGMTLKENGPLSITEIANHAASRMPTITKLVYKMQTQGLVEIKPKEGDGRVSVVAITDEGLELINSVIRDTSKLYDKAYGDLSERQLTALIKAQQTIFNNLSGD